MSIFKNFKGREVLENRNDTNLNTQLRNGVHSAFLTIYNTYARELYFFTKKYIRENSVCDDIIHDSFLNLWNARARIKDSPSVQFYLFKIARNLVFKELKKQIASAQLFEYEQHHLLDVDGGDCVESILVTKEYNNIYDLAINTLPPQRKRIFRMSREEGMSYKEIASHLDISNQTVKEHMSLAMKSMKDYIAKEHNIILKSVLCLLFFDNIL